MCKCGHTKLAHYLEGGSCKINEIVPSIICFCVGYDEVEELEGHEPV